ncbi:MAG TPA: UPF0182 family protein [Terracidiphilus sp.]|jgi:hypothetical protein|nr:UPF0182 family protein [Terracidiphilus sp.]
MPETIQWPPRSDMRGPRRAALFLLVPFVVILFAGRASISWWVDLLWFHSLGYESVFWKTWTLQWGTFAAFGVLTFLILYGALLLLRRMHAEELPDRHTIFVGGRPIDLPVGRALHVAAIVLAGLIALATAAAMQAQWAQLALYWHAPAAAAGTADPIFGQPLNFYLFTLPAWQILAGWLLTLAILICIAAALFLMAAGGARALDREQSAPVRLPWRGVSVAAGFLLLTLALREYIGRFDLLLEHHTIFDGVTYTDAHVNILGMSFIAAAMALGGVIAIAGGLLRPGGRWLAAAVAPAIVCYVVAGIAGWYVSNFLVKPNQLDRERPYIAYNIAMTRKAYGLDRFTQHEFPAETDPGAADPTANQQTLNNIRLWDVQALQDTLRQVQEIRTYYDFPDIDIDRYEIDGTLHEEMLAARELNVDKLPDSSRNWINDKLIYTHGYGITMNPVNGFTPEGLPTLQLSNMPVQSTVPSINVTQPEIYYGEMTNTDVYVKTHQQEFNYPEGQSNNLTSYNGTGGIVLGGFLRRLFIAFDRGDITKLPFSDDVTPQSRLLMRRNIAARVAAIAPFLTFEQDPYVVVGGDGRLYWIIDAFTSSDTYPYSTQTALGDAPLNYMRNSVKVAIDAYDGTTTFYVFDNADPILAAWRGIYPGLFKDASQMPAWLRKHVRYPELLLSLQAEVYGLYHMTNPEVFYNREDLWTVATQTGQSNAGDQTAEPMEPNFVLMTLPGESTLEFVEILPFTPANRNNMIGWIAARSDGAHYGTAVVYDFPKTRLVDGPQQIEARIDQNAQLSGQLTLWNQQGSHVLRGSLLVIPCGKALLYAEPIYLQAQRSPMPELRIVVLALQDRLAYGPDFQSALASLFGGAPSSLSESQAAQSESGSGSTSGSGAASTSGATPGGTAAPRTPDLNALIGQANGDFNDYQRLTSQGKLSQAGQKLDDLKRVLGELNAHAK